MINADQNMLVHADDGNSANIQSTFPSLDLKELYASFFRGRYVIGIIFAVCLAGAVIATLLITKQYEGVVSVEVRQEAEKVLGTEADSETAATKVDVERFLETQRDLVKSRRVATAVATELRLFDNSFLDDMKVRESPETGAVLNDVEARRELVLKILNKNLDVAYTGQTRILSIKFRSPDARLSAKIANSFADNYIKINLQRKADSSSYALNFLRQQLSEAQAKLEASERNALDYARRTRIVDASNSAGSRANGGNSQPQSLITAQLVQLNEAYSEAVSARIASEERWARTSSTSLLNIPEVLANQAIQGLLEQRAVLESEYRLQLETRKDDFPSVRQAAAKLKEIDRQLTAVANNIKQSIRGQYQIAQSQESRLRAQLDQLKSSTLVEQNQSIQLSILRREADTNRLQYEALLRRYNQLNAESGVQANNISIIDAAMPRSKPSWPNVYLNVGFALMLAVVLAGAYVLVDSQLLDKIRTAYDVTQRLSFPLLGVIPKTESILEDLGDQKSPATEAFNLVRASLLMTSQGGAPASAMVTSVVASEGKTSSCIALAVGFGRLGKRVVLIDLDLRRPNIHRQLNLSNRMGISSVLTGQKNVQEVLQDTSFPGLSVVTSGPLPPSPTDLIMGEALRNLIISMQDDFDIVLVDGPPVLALADAEILASSVESVIFIMESGRNNRRSAQNALMRVARTADHMAGVILTKYDAASQGYGGYSDYSYSYKYDAKDE